MQLTTMSVDDFYPAPDAATRIAKSLEFKSVNYRDHTYHGVGLGYDPENMDKLIGNVFGAKVKIDMQHFRLGTSAIVPTTYIHADSGIAPWAAVWYLSEAPKGLVAGTAFWRHKETGFDEIPSLDWITNHFPGGIGEFITKMEADGADESKWDMVGLIGQKYNRMALYPGRKFHSRYPKDAWGTDITDGRLAWTCFFSYDK